MSKRGEDADRTENWDIYLIEPKPGAKERQLTTTVGSRCSSRLGKRAGLEPGWKNDRLHPRRRSEENCLCDAFARDHSRGRGRAEIPDRAARSQFRPAALGARWEIDFRHARRRRSGYARPRAGGGRHSRAGRGRTAQSDRLRCEQRRQGHRPGEHAGPALRDLRGRGWRAALPDETKRFLPRPGPARAGRGNKIQERGRNGSSRIPGSSA